MSEKTSYKQKQLNNFNKQLKTYSLAVGAVLIASKNVNAIIHHNDLGSGVVIDRTNDVFAIDFGNDGITNFIFNLVTSGASLSSLVVKPQTTGAYVRATTLTYNVNALNQGDEVNNATASWMNHSYTGNLGARRTTYSGGTTSIGYFQYTTNKYVGVYFNLNSKVNYGWIQVKMPGDMSYSIITGYAYNDEDDGNITAGQIPEAGSLALLALGAMGLAAWRKGRR